MRAIVIKHPGGPDVLALEQRPRPQAGPGEVLIEVKAFGLNQAEVYFRQGKWGEVAEISGIECVGLVADDPSGCLDRGQKVLAVVGGLGRSRNGSYAEYTVAPASNVAAIDSNLPWETLAAIPESYATAWACLLGNLQLQPGQALLIRGATSALGQAALQIAVHHGARVIATTRNAERAAGLKERGAAEVWLDTPRDGQQFDAVLDLVGTTTILDSMALLRRGGRACLAGFRGGGAALAQFEPVFQLPGGRHLSVFASALELGTAEFPLDEIPFRAILEHVSHGHYQATPSRVFAMADIQAAHRLLESGQANGKIVVHI